MSGTVFTAWRLFVRFRHGRHQGRPLFGAAFGIALSLIPLVVVDHFAAAMIDGIIARYRETSSYHFQITSWAAHERDEWDNLVDNLVQRKGIRMAWIERSGFGLARAKGARDGLTLRALPADAPSRDPVFAQYIVFDEGSWNLEGNSVLLGREAARRLSASVGDELLLLTARTTLNNRIIPKISRLIVQGVFTTGYQDLDRTWAFIPLELGWTILPEDSSRTFVGGKLDSLNQDPQIWVDIQHDLISGWTAYDWRDINRYLLSNLESTRSILLLIMALIIVVAVFNVMTSLVMLTLEHRREIGILKCTGTAPKTISRIFVLAGTMAALAGTLFGLCVGALMAYNINAIIGGIEYVLALIVRLFGDGLPPSLLNEGYYLQHIPIYMRWSVIVIIGLTTLVLSVGASWIPAYRAARLKPLEVLQKH